MSNTRTVDGKAIYLGKLQQLKQVVYITIIRLLGKHIFQIMETSEKYSIESLM